MRGNVLMIGLGLIGGSIALSIKKEHPKALILGYDVDRKQVQLAKALKVIDEETLDYKEAAGRADVIIIGVPVQATSTVMESLSACTLKKSVIITDVGSTKAKIMKEAERLFSMNYTFIGGHPMAGSHKSGVAAAKVHLFENAFYILTPSAHAGVKEVAELKMWLKGTKAKFIEVDAHEHDLMTGVISHLPHIMAASIVNQAEQAEAKHDLVARLAAGGFRDITRIASSSPQMWKDILIQNDQVLIDLLDSWIDEMSEVREWIRTKDEERLYSFFQSAKMFRDEMPARKKGAIPSFYDLYVDVPDYPGVISEITGYLAKSNISITNIRIIETREEVYGVLVISFQSGEDRKLAVECLRDATNYDTYYD
ncbi:prephenate dehydrogenase [Bacillus sp. D386]|uniref:prephenate dehydrogenase n=1 Tax=Bacillus sp. D386 TaxID=2587155 RepID=UPI00111C9CE2|nr:prephenate dehydrogenase [Bacillus sp. D386]